MRSTFATLLFIAIFACASRGAHSDEANEVEGAPSVLALYPDVRQELWGYQQIEIYYAHTGMVRVKDVAIDIGHGDESLITDSNPLRVRDDHDELTWCVQCADASRATITVTFDGAPTIRRTYQIRAEPVVDVDARYDEDAGTLILDASGSLSPQGSALTYAWRRGGDGASGPIYRTAASSQLGRPIPITLTVSDGHIEVNEMMTYRIGVDHKPIVDPKTKKPIVIYTNEKLKCTGMEVVDKGDSLLNPGVPLGAIPANAKPMWPVGNNNALSKDFFVGHVFEVRATIEVGEENFYEGQGIATTVSASGKDIPAPPLQARTTGAPAGQFEPTLVSAPYPATPVKAPETVPTNDDDYQAHPQEGIYLKNGTVGLEAVQVKKKDLDQTKTKLVWIDNPGSALRAGTPSVAGSKHMFFHAWMTPDLKKCEKYFTIEIDWDKDGNITKNDLTRLN